MPWFRPSIKLPLMFASTPAVKPPKLALYLSSACLIQEKSPLEALKIKLHMAMLPPNKVVRSLTFFIAPISLLPLGER